MEIETNLDEQYSILKKNKRKKLIILLLVIIFLILIISSILLYFLNKDIRHIIDNYIFNKEISIDTLSSINIDEEDNIILYNDYIGILTDQKINFYTQDGFEDTSISLEVQNPIYDTCGRYLAIASSDGQNIYIIENRQLKQTLKIEGNIQKIKINSNGYLAVSINNNIYKSILEYYDTSYNLVFRTYFSDEIITSISISSSSEYLAVSTLINSAISTSSNINIIDVKKLEQNSNTYQMEKISLENELVANIYMQNIDEISILTTTGIFKYENGQILSLVKFDASVIYSNIDMKNCVYYVNENNGEYVLNIENINSQKAYNYSLDYQVKQIQNCLKYILVNMQTKVDIVNRYGLLIKSVECDSQIVDTRISDNLAILITQNELYILKI